MAPGMRRFSCSWKQCKKAFNRKSDLSRHYRIHINERPYHCAYEGCNKRFIQRSALTVHLRTHTGEKPYVCKHEGCHRAFSDSSSLARHRRTHTGRRPYACQAPMCQMRFSRKVTLSRHEIRSHPPAATGLILSEDAVTREGNRSATTAASHLYDSYPNSQQSYCAHISAQYHELYLDQIVLSTHRAIDQHLQIEPQPIPAISYRYLQQAQPQHMQLTQPSNISGVNYASSASPPLFFDIPRVNSNMLVAFSAQGIQFQQTPDLNQVNGNDILQRSLSIQTGDTVGKSLVGCAQLMEQDVVITQTSRTPTDDHL